MTCICKTLFPTFPRSFISLFLSKDIKMSEKRTIQINPDLFKINNKTRKNQPKGPKIELRSELKAQKQKTLRKNVLKMIREKQQDAYRDLFEKKKPSSSTPPSVKEFNQDFDESVKFFSSLATKVETPPANHTFKNFPPPNTIGSSMTPSMTLSPPVVTITPPDPLSPPIQILPPPPYGCLKNGLLPTFRSQTRKNQPFQDTALQTTAFPDTPLLTRPFDSESFVTLPPSQSFRTPPPNPFIEQSKKFDKLHATKSTNQKLRYKKRKKIFRRTYKVGRSTTEPVIGVLISNKTIRNRISTEAQLLKQTPIHDVRKFLIKKGLIKVGTNAPNDVLRKMYETVSLVCGEIQNHNPENLLFNFIHDKE